MSTNLTLQPTPLHLDGNDGDCSDGYEGLSVIEVTPKVQSKDSPRGEIFKLASRDDYRFRRNTSQSSESSGTSSRPTPSFNQGHSQGTNSSISVSSLFSGLKRTLDGSNKDESKDDDPIVFASPVSVRIDNIQAKANHHSDSMNDEDHLQNLVFTTAESNDACEFREYLEESGGDKINTPVFCLVDYGIGSSFASDMWTLVHNAIRRELFDIFEVMEAVRRLCMRLTVSDIYNVRKWWRFFVILWSEYIAHEKETLSPIIQQICQIDGRGEALQGQLRLLREDKEWLTLKMEEVTSYIEEFEMLPPGRALCLFCRTVDIFANKLTLYFTAQERILPGLVECYHDEKLKMTVDRQLVERLRLSDHFPELLVCMVRWMGSVEGFSSPKTQSQQRDRWLASHLNWLERLKIPGYVHRFELNHGSVLKHFRTRLDRCGLRVSFRKGR